MAGVLAVDRPIGALCHRGGEYDNREPTLYVPNEHLDRVLTTYGHLTMRDLDRQHRLNARLGELGEQGELHETSFQTMMHLMNERNGDVSALFERFRNDAVASDLFNIVQSAVRSRCGETVWYL